MSEPSFADLVAEANAAPVDGWGFDWLADRATEERPSWGYSRLLADRVSTASAVLDLQTGGGEVLAELPRRPATMVATEGWPPNVAVARHNLEQLGVRVVEAADDADLPFDEETFDLVSSRHPTMTRWDEVARVLAPGGTYLSQQIGPGSAREVSEAMLGPLDVGLERSPENLAADAEKAGLRVVDLRHERLRMTFHDVGAVIYFLRKVVWIVPGFTVDRHRDQLAALHDRIRAEGPFVAHSARVLIEARKPART